MQRIFSNSESDDPLGKLVGESASKDWRPVAVVIVALTWIGLVVANGIYSAATSKYDQVANLQDQVRTLTTQVTQSGETFDIAVKRLNSLQDEIITRPGEFTPLSIELEKLSRDIFAFVSERQTNEPQFPRTSNSEDWETAVNVQIEYMKDTLAEYGKRFAAPVSAVNIRLKGRGIANETLDKFAAQPVNPLMISAVAQALSEEAERTRQ
jgi:hypothetical protein